MPALYLATTATAGDQVSSTYEGRHITLEESYLTHPYHAADNWVNKGDPVLINDEIVGVAFTSATANTDLIAIDTEGIWFLEVFGCISDGTVNGAAHALAAGDPVYIKRVPGTDTVILSGQSDPQNYRRFGYLLGDVSADLESGTADLVAVKVHGATSQLTNPFDYGVYMGVMGDNLEIDLVAQKATGQLEASALGMFVRPSTIMAANGDRIHAIKVRLEDTLAAVGGDLQGIRTQVHCNNVAGVWERIYGQYIAIANTASATITESFGLSINMGGAGAAPATQCLIQMIGDGTLGTLQGWFDTEIGRGAGLKADATSINVNRAFEIPIIIDGVRYCIPVIAWI